MNIFSFDKYFDISSDLLYVEYFQFYLFIKRNTETKVWSNF